jgi:hypothetical protein
MSEPDLGSLENAMSTVLVGAILTGLRGNHAMTAPMVADVSDDRMTEQFGTMKNHAAWQLAHIVTGLGFAANLLQLDYAAPDGWREKYGNGSPVPTADRSRYPDKALLLTEIDRAVDALMTGFAAADAAVLEAEMPVASFRTFWPTVADGAAFLMTTHYAFHLGQLSTWRRGLGLGKALPF